MLVLNCCNSLKQSFNKMSDRRSLLILILPPKKEKRRKRVRDLQIEYKKF